MLTGTIQTLKLRARHARAVPAGAGLSSTFSPPGNVPSFSIDGRRGVSPAGAAQVHEVGGGADEWPGHLALLFASRGEDGYGSATGRAAATAGAADNGRI